MRREAVCQAGQTLGYIEHRPLGDLWAALPFGLAYPPPMFSRRHLALAYVRRFGRPRSGSQQG